MTKKMAKRWTKIALSRYGLSFVRKYNLIESIEGYMVSPSQEYWLYRTARDLPDNAIIAEIGSFKGRSTCAMGLGCAGTNKTIYAIDTFNGNDSDFHQRDFYNEFLRNITKCGVSDRIITQIGMSLEISKSWSKQIDMLFIDGSHEYEDVLCDYREYSKFVRPGGIIAFHDVIEGWEGPLKVWNEFASKELDSTGNCYSLYYGHKK